MSKKGRISHDRIEALEKEVAELKDQMRKLVAMLDDEVAPIIEKHRATITQGTTSAQRPTANGYVPQFDHWPGNER